MAQQHSTAIATRARAIIYTIVSIKIVFVMQRLENVALQ